MIFLAPMEGVTDAPMRAFLTEQTPYDFCVSEFLRVSEQVLPHSVFKKHIPELSTQGRTASGIPVIVQLLGGHPERLALSALRAVELGAQGIDLNFGCPAPTVNRHDGGATLLQYPERLYEITQAVRNAVPRSFSVSVKVRLGWSDPHDIFKNLEALQKAEPSWITIHARTRMQGYAKPILWQYLKPLLKEATVPLVANGDLWSFPEFLRCYEMTGYDHYMLGRGALAQPFLAGQIQAFLNHKTVPVLSNPLEQARNWLPLVRRFSELARPFTQEEAYLVRRIKQWVRLASLASSDPLLWFEELKKAQSLEEILSCLDKPSAAFESRGQEPGSGFRPTDTRDKSLSSCLQQTLL